MKGYRKLTATLMADLLIGGLAYFDKIDGTSAVQTIAALTAGYLALNFAKGATPTKAPAP